MIPKSLKKNDTIGIVSPAKFITQDKLTPAIKIIEDWGLKVKVGNFVHEEYNQFAGTDEQRASDFQEMLDDDKIQAILCSRGGYGTIRIIDKLDFSKFIIFPKWIIGYSDITILHTYLNSKLNIASLHATMPINFEKNDKESLISLRKCLYGETIEYNITNHHLNKQGVAKGILIGGNLSVLYSLSGTKYDIDTKDKILFLEDLDEYLYHIDRMLMNLKLSGKLKHLKGLIVGKMSNMNDNKVPFGKSANKIIAEIVSEYNFPVCYNFPTGHEKLNHTLMMGCKIEMKVKNNEIKISYLV